MYLSSGTEGCQFFCFEFKLALKGYLLYFGHVQSKDQVCRDN